MIPEIPLVTPKEAQELAVAKLGRWVVQPATHTILEELEAEHVTIASLGNISQFIATPTRYTLKQKGRNLTRVGHQGQPHPAILCWFDGTIVGIMETSRIDTALEGSTISIVCPTGRPRPGEAMEAAALREAEEETGFRVGQITHLSLANRIAGSCHVRLRYHPFMAVLDPCQPSGYTPQPWEETLAVRFTPADWITMMLDGDILEEGAIGATMAAMGHSELLLQTFNEVCRSRATFTHRRR
jgi:8-oxo-dGTP pyrophosphatase MutT (NUDIX family)